MINNNFPEELDKDLNKFNWGASALGFIWAASNGCYKGWTIKTSKVTLYALILSVFVSVILYPLLILFMSSYFYFLFCLILAFLFIFLVNFIYSGKYGSRIAWEYGKFKSAEEFRNAQNYWQKSDF